MAGTDLHMSRRGALGLAAAASVAGGGAASLGPGASAGAARRLGLAFVAANGAAAARALVATAFGAGAGGPPDDLPERVAADFRAGRTVLLEGFLLARSELAAWLIAAGVRAA